MNARFPALLSLLLAAATARAQMPTYVAMHGNLNGYSSFADGGFDGNWYVGYNNCWIARLPAAPPGQFPRVFLGARLGRAKTQPLEGKPWEREPIPGKIYIGVSQSPEFPPSKSFFLASTDDIPLEPQPNEQVPGVGEGRWFWVEVPRALVSANSPNFMAIWSPTNEFTSREKSPILGGLKTKQNSAAVWLNRSIKGAPPRVEQGALETAINHLAPALAIKLVPYNSARVAVQSLRAQKAEDGTLLEFTASGTDVRQAWVELSQDKIEWERVSSFLYTPPYQFTLPPDTVPARGAWLRGAAADTLENTATGAPLFYSPVNTASSQP